MELNKVHARQGVEKNCGCLKNVLMCCDMCSCTDIICTNKQIEMCDTSDDDNLNNDLICYSTVYRHILFMTMQYEGHWTIFKPKLLHNLVYFCF